MGKKLSIRDIELSGKNVFMRVDFNVPLDANQNITEDARIRAAIPTIQYALEKGAVVVLGLDKIDRKTGLCKAAGPIVNLVYGTILLIISFILPTSLYPLNMFIGIAAALNFTLGLFNMIPIGILDGQNIFKWNKQLYLILFSALLLLLIITYANVYAPLQANPYIPDEWKTTA